MNVKTVQEALQTIGLYKGKLDNKSGPLTRAGVDQALERLVPEVNWRNWPETRKRVAVMQALFRLQKIETGIVDGYDGPQTRYALGVYRHLNMTGKKPELWRDNMLPVPPKTVLPVAPKGNDWPRQRALTKYYGRVGKNQTLLHTPFPLKIAWNKKQVISRFSIHEKCHDSAERVFARIHAHYSPQQLEKHGMNLFGGCLNVRKMRGGSSWSTHAWGIAIDFDPIRNQLRWGRDRAYLDNDECAQFWKFWEAEGWLSLGRTRNFDWMHVQAARL